MFRMQYLMVGMGSGEADRHARSVIVMMMMVVEVVARLMAGRIGQEEGTADERGRKNGQDFLHWVPLDELRFGKREGTAAWCLL